MDQQNSSNSGQGGLSWSEQRPTLPSTPVAAEQVRSAPSFAYLTVAALAGLIVGVLITWTWYNFSAAPASDSPGATETVRNGDNGTSDTASALLAVEEQNAGTSVTVTGLSPAEPLWVVIYDDNEGKAGNALGAKLVGKGDTTATVHLLRSTASGKTYLAGLQRDNGDRIFSLRSDAQMTNEQGVPLLVTFSVK